MVLSNVEAEASSYIDAVLGEFRAAHPDTTFRALAVELDTGADGYENMGHLHLYVADAAMDPTSTHVYQWTYPRVEEETSQRLLWSPLVHQTCDDLWSESPTVEAQAIDRLEEIMRAVANAVIGLQRRARLRALGFDVECLLSVFAPGELEEEDLPLGWIQYARTNAGISD